MAELFTANEVQAYLRKEVAAAGGAKKFLRKKKLDGFSHILHMFENGDAATLDRVLPALGFRRVTRYESVESE